MLRSVTGCLALFDVTRVESAVVRKRGYSVLVTGEDREGKPSSGALSGKVPCPGGAFWVKPESASDCDSRL